MQVIIDFTPLEVFSVTPQEIKDNQKIEILMSHDIKNLKLEFYSVFGINVPLDLLNETDENYIKKNIADCLLVYYNSLEFNKSIPLTDIFFKCKKCNHWAYFVFVDNKNICEECLTNSIPQKKEEGLLAWKK